MRAQASMVQGDSELDDAEKLMTFREVHRTDSETKIAHGVHEGVNERIMQPSEERHLKHGWLHTGPDGCGDPGLYGGEVIAGRPHGSGCILLKNGNSYAGEWRSGNFHGLGCAAMADGGVYAGEFEQGKPEGKGVLEMQDGARYAGEWRAGTKHGLGVELVRAERETTKLNLAYFEHDYLQEYVLGPDATGRACDTELDKASAAARAGETAAAAARKAAECAEQLGHENDGQGTRNTSGQARSKQKSNKGECELQRNVSVRMKRNEAIEDELVASLLELRALDLRERRERVELAQAEVRAGSQSTVLPIPIQARGEGEVQKRRAAVAALAEAMQAKRAEVEYAESLLLSHSKLVGARLEDLALMNGNRKLVKGCEAPTPSTSPSLALVRPLWGQMHRPGMHEHQGMPAEPRSDRPPWGAGAGLRQSMTVDLKKQGGLLATRLLAGSVDRRVPSRYRTNRLESLPGEARGSVSPDVAKGRVRAGVTGSLSVPLVNRHESSSPQRDADVLGAHLRTGASKGGRGSFSPSIQGRRHSTISPLGGHEQRRKHSLHQSVLSPKSNGSMRVRLEQASQESWQREGIASRGRGRRSRKETFKTTAEKRDDELIAWATVAPLDWTALLTPNRSGSRPVPIEVGDEPSAWAGWHKGASRTGPSSEASEQELQDGLRSIPRQAPWFGGKKSSTDGAHKLPVDLSSPNKSNSGYGTHGKPKKRARQVAEGRSGQTSPGGVRGLRSAVPWLGGGASRELTPHRLSVPAQQGHTVVENGRTVSKARKSVGPASSRLLTPERRRRVAEWLCDLEAEAERMFREGNASLARPRTPLISKVAKRFFVGKKGGNYGSRCDIKWSPIPQYFRQSKQTSKLGLSPAQVRELARKSLEGKLLTDSVQRDGVVGL